MLENQLCRTTLVKVAINLGITEKKPFWCMATTIVRANEMVVLINDCIACFLCPRLVDQGTVGWVHSWYFLALERILLGHMVTTRAKKRTLLTFY